MKNIINYIQSLASEIKTEPALDDGYTHHVFGVKFHSLSDDAEAELLREIKSSLPKSIKTLVWRTHPVIKKEANNYMLYTRFSIIE